MIKESYIKLGEFIEQCNERNINEYYGADELRGINNEGNVMPSKANIIGVSFHTYKIAHKGYFIYNPARLDIGSMSCLQEEVAIFSQMYVIFKIKEKCKNTLLTEYLWMWFKRKEFFRYVAFVNFGSVREMFTYEDMCNVMLPVPPIEEQRRIVSEYQTVERRIANNEALIQKLEETAQAIYHHTFVEGIDEENLPEGWRKGCLEDISESISAGTIPVYHESEYLVLGQKCNNNHKIDLSLCKTHIPKVSVTFLKKGDTLINSTGNGTLGRVATVLFHPVNLAYDSNMTMVRPLEKKYSCYISCLLKTKEKYFIELSQGSTNQTRLYCSMIRPLSVLIPTDFVLEEFETRISMLYDYTYYLQQENIHLRTLLSLLTSKLS